MILNSEKRFKDKIKFENIKYLIEPLCYSSCFSLIRNKDFIKYLPLVLYTQINVSSCRSKYKKKTCCRMGG